jgi:5-methylcytosine-specific restriction endonuclease McrA
MEQGMLFDGGNVTDGITAGVDARKQRGMEIAAIARINKRDGMYLVPSVTNPRPTQYKVKYDAEHPTCTCDDHTTRQCRCKHIYLPDQIDGALPSNSPQKQIDIESVDFFHNREHLSALLDREQNRCFYTLRQVTRENAVLDHVIPQVNGGGNSYRNVVIACHDVNALKQGEGAEDFIRKLYRIGVLNLAEMEDRLRAVDALKAGKLVPQLSLPSP